MPSQTSKDLRGAARQYLLRAVALLLAIYTLPDAFSLFVGNDLDSSWVRAINNGVRQKLVFGTDLIFTYGPLGYLGTRFTQYMPDTGLLLADIFICSCFYYIIYKIISQHKNWIPIVAVAIYYCKGCDYSELLFLFFLVFLVRTLQAGTTQYFELIACGICATVVFFVKLNYGVIALPILLLLLGILLRTNRRSFWVLFLTSAIVFFCILVVVPINLYWYVRNGLPIILNYPEGMAMDLTPVRLMYIGALVLCGLYCSIPACYVWQQWRKRSISFAVIFAVLVLLLMCFLMYKNGFTMLHISWFYYVMPLFAVFTIYLLGFGGKWQAQLLCATMTGIVFVMMPLPRGNGGKGFVREAITDPIRGYFSSLYVKEDLMQDPNFQLPDDKLATIGQSTVDILPVDVSLLFQHHLNYKGRPVIQTYSAYSPMLDSLNAQHFCRAGRPRFALAALWSIEDKYAMWEESMTKCALHLNYEFVDFFKLKNHTDANDPTATYVLLQAGNAPMRWPKFERLYDTIVNFDEVMRLHLPSDQAIYMTADVQYTGVGKLTNLLYQPPILTVSLYTDSAFTKSMTKRVIRPLLQEPQLINKQIVGNGEYRDFLTGHISSCRQVTGFAFHNTGNSCKRQIKLTFYKFANY